MLELTILKNLPGKFNQVSTERNSSNKINSTHIRQTSVRFNDKFSKTMVDKAESNTIEWFQVTESVEIWEDQIRKLKEDLPELSDGELEFDFVPPLKIEEGILKR